MQKRRNIQWFLYVLISVALVGCATNTTKEANPAMASTPVTVTTISKDRLTEYIELNATSVFQRKNISRSTATGFLSAMNVSPGAPVNKGEVLFTLITKEAAALQKGAITNDSSMQFKGEIKIRASQSGIISSIAHQQGDYVQEGDELVTIAEPASRVFNLQVPFELAGNMHAGQSCEIMLPDNKQTEGIIGTILPTADALSQAMAMVVKPVKQENIPENIIVRVRIAKSFKKEAFTLPKEAVLTNETQTEFWVMKLVSDTLAVKIPVRKGVEQDDRIEILQPLFEKTERFIVIGNYGLADSAKINIVK
jgi:multidrug efflux pump subunit AcrA (membrane-fusion protein)